MGNSSTTNFEEIAKTGVGTTILVPTPMTTEERIAVLEDKVAKLESARGQLIMNLADQTIED
jgi:O-acetylhomoserine/O-acetylserine sulfhydrylase-like pyridoxal-dependent enzyme